LQQVVAAEEPEQMDLVLAVVVLVVIDLLLLDNLLAAVGLQNLH